MPTLTINDKHSESIDVQLPDTTLNFGDADPQRHGGLFAEYDDMGVNCVVTIPPYDLPEDYCHGQHLVTRKCGYYDDMLDHSGDKTVATNFLKDEIDAWTRCDSVVQAAVDGHLPGMMAWATDRHHIRRENFVSDEEYAETMINNYGVPKECL